MGVIDFDVKARELDSTTKRGLLVELDASGSGFESSRTKEELEVKGVEGQ